MEKQISELKSRIFSIYKSTQEPLNNNIYRGHLRSISTDIEDSIAVFISSLLPETYCLILDPSIYVDGKNNRPDLLIVNDKQEVIAMIEIKANMGWCRDAQWVLKDMVENNNKFILAKTLLCEISNGENKEVYYGSNVPMFLISLTDGNCSESKHEANKNTADELGIKHYLLFLGWYGGLRDRDIECFANDILSLRRATLEEELRKVK